MAHQDGFDGDFGRVYKVMIRTINPTVVPLFDMTHAFLASRLAADSHLLVVGAGGGQEIETLAPTHAGWTITGVDPSDTMLQLAHDSVSRLELQNRITLVRGTLEDLPAGVQFDGATCMMVLHFLPDQAAKRELLRHLHARLRAGSVLVLSTLVGDADSVSYKQQMDAWSIHKGWAGMPSEQINQGADIMRTHSLAPEQETVSLLQEAGFSDVSLFYATYLYRGWIATRR